MDYLRISKFTEADFDEIIESIGGRRFSSDDSREKKLNCDYVLSDALIELKLVEEGVVDKKTKRNKLANLFGKKTKTVVIDPERLSRESKSQYYRILETPIKTALKKASKQLQEASATNKNSVKIAIIINNGLSLMMPDEFERIAIKCATNDTSGIDILLTGGNYFYSDKFDSYAIFPLKELYLNGQYRTDIVDLIRAGWDEFLYRFMNNQIIDVAVEKRNREPLQDISFCIEDVLYIKPHPKMGKPSAYFPHGRPREDSTGLTSCPTVATILPKLEIKGYEIAKNSMIDSFMLRDNLNSYLNWIAEETNNTTSLTHPSISVLVPSYKANANSFQELCRFATDIFNSEINAIIDKSKEYTHSHHQSLNYILLNCNEIGIDKANDISFIEHIIEYPGLERQTLIIDGERLKFEYALAIASAYCIKLGADCVYYLRDIYYKWT